MSAQRQQPVSCKRCVKPLSFNLRYALYVCILVSPHPILLSQSRAADVVFVLCNEALLSPACLQPKRDLLGAMLAYSSLLIAQGAKGVRPRVVACRPVSKTPLFFASGAEAVLACCCSPSLGSSRCICIVEEIRRRQAFLNSQTTGLGMEASSRQPRVHFWALPPPTLVNEDGLLLHFAKAAR